jgi:hypothetical protein
MPQNAGSFTGSGARGEGFWEDAAVKNGGAGVLAQANREAGSSTGSAFQLGDARRFKARLRTTGGSGTLVARLEVSTDGSTWVDAGSFQQLGRGATQTARVFDVRGYSQARWAWTVAGSAVTFGISPERFV